MIWAFLHPAVHASFGHMTIRAAADPRPLRRLNAGPRRAGQRLSATLNFLNLFAPAGGSFSAPGKLKLMKLPFSLGGEER